MPAPRKSLEEHALHGTRPNGRAADVSQVPSGRPKFPRDLDSSLKPIFKRLCSLLAERRVLSAADGELIRLYVFMYDRHVRNAAVLRSEGEIKLYTRLDSNGQPHQMEKANLRLKIVADAERTMAGILSQLGLTPTAKDRAKPTRGSEEKVVPGSIADTMPFLLKPDAAEPELIVPFIDPADMVDPEESDGSSASELR
jgi:P27 family predicted phage terminase small subunit